MRLKFLAGAVAGGVALAGGLGLYFSSKAVGNQANGPAKVDGNQLPIAQVILFSSGVGYFQREGEVQGSTRVDLTFQQQDINDLLKSMVLQDLGGGNVSAVSYDSQAPVEKTLRSFAINLTGAPSFSGILNQARGERVEAVLQQSNTTQPANLTGVILGVEQQRQAVNKEVVEVEMLNLWCAEGMRSVKLTEVQRVRFLNPVVESEMKKALETLALSHDTQKKAVSINFNGDGKRAVKVGYVVENPIWKTSYRLVMGKKDAKPFLQGWAVVENTQDEDWNNVRMALVSGRPISFQMDLYQPLFVTRPVVEPELFASLRPPTYTGAMDRDYRANRPAAAEMPMDANGRARGEGKAAGFGGAERESLQALRQQGDQLRKKMDEEVRLKGAGVASAAVATELGDFFQYIIEQPVNLPRQKSAMLPIVNQEVEGTKVSIYNQGTHPKFPLHGLKFKNSTNLHLSQGPITVFDGASYAGDARILDLQPKEERLISYAIDLGTEVEPVVVNPPQRLIKVKVTRGLIEATNKVRQEKTYNIKNRSEHDRLVILEHPYNSLFNLIKPEKANERARDVYRFEIPVKTGELVKHEVIEERDVVSNVSISNADDNTIRVFLSSPIASQKVKDALTRAIELKGKIADTQRDLAHANKQLADITADQVRLRANLKEMPPTAAAYKRYLDKFDQQETEIEKLRDDIKKLQNTDLLQKRGLDAWLVGLNID